MKEIMINKLYNEKDLNLNMLIIYLFKGQMVAILTDQQITDFINEKKNISGIPEPSFKSRRSSQHFEQDIEGERGNMFKIIIRVSNKNPMDFSVILAVKIGSKLFRLKRYNGDSHDHTNEIEKEHISGCHIHKATQRYQEKGYREEGYAQKSDKYSDWKKALSILINENNFQINVPKEQRRLFN